MIESSLPDPLPSDRRGQNAIGAIATGDGQAAGTAAFRSFFTGRVSWSVLSWRAEAWAALGSMMLGLGLIVTGAWSIFNYRRARKAGEARMLHQAFDTFYLAETFIHIRLMLEYHYEDQVGPLLERRISDRRAYVEGDDERLLAELDDLLNFMELLEYQREKGQIPATDRDALFEYWISMIDGDRKGALRCYLRHFGYERTAELFATSEARYVFAYGSLRADVKPTALDPPVMGPLMAERYGLAGTSLGGEVICEEARISGYSMYDTGKGYPAVVWDGTVPNIADVGTSDRPRIVGTLWYFPPAVSMGHVLDVLDRYEGVGRLPYRRRLARVNLPQSGSHPTAIDAWIYEFGEDPSNSELVVGGDWSAHLSGPGS